MMKWGYDQMSSNAQNLKRKSAGTKKSKKGKNTWSKPLLLPHVTGIRKVSDNEFHLIIKDGLVDIGGEFWTTERLADELFYCMAITKAEPELVNIPSINDENSCGKSTDLLEEYESSTTLLYRKYIIHAEKLAGEYCNDKLNIFRINLADLTERLQAELIDLQTTKNSRRAIACVLHSVVGRIFALASLAWFYESAREEIQVILEP
jgi:hypothetical protein